MMLTADIFESAGRMALGSLAVLGGAALGAFAVGFFTNLAATFAIGRPSPTTVLRWMRVLGGLSGGFVVGWFVFQGGPGFGFGGRGTGDSGSGTRAGLAAQSVTSEKAQEAPIPEIGVVLLGGSRVRNAAFYQIEGQPTAKTLSEIQTILQATSRPGKLVLFIYQDSVAQDHPAVADLESWARERGWRVGLEKQPGPLPAEGARP